jgi:hypothetical protein
MRVDVDFESYAAARWHLVVRSLVLLGVPPGHAAALTRQALAQLRAEWSHQDAHDDLDAELYRAVLDLKRHDAASWWAEPPFDDELWTDIEPELDRLPQAQREWLVLRHVAELPESYVGAVVGEPDPGARSGVPSGERLRDVAQTVPVHAPDLEQVVAMAGDMKRRRRRRSFVTAAVVLGAVGAAALVVALTAGDETGDPARELAAVPVERAPTLSDVGWYADGRLHLAEVVLDLPDLQDVATINDGAVYRDAEGDLVLVNDQGQRTVLATIGERGTFVASDEDGLVAWVPEGQDATLVVRDLTGRSDVVRFDVEGEGEVIAVDSGSAYVRDDRGDHEITLETGEVENQGTDNLLDVSLRVRAYQQTSSTINVVQPLFDIAYTWPGEGAQLSEDGAFVLTWVGDDLAVYDTRSGDAVPADLAPGSRVLDAEFGPDDTITYLALQHRSSSGTVDVRTCSFRPRYLESGETLPRCTQEAAGIFSGVLTDLLLAR